MGSMERAVANAREVVRTLRAEGASRADLTRLREALAEGIYTRRLDPVALRQLVDPVIRSMSGSDRWGPFGWDAAKVVDMLRVMAVGINHVETGTVTDAELVEARERLRAALLDYAASWRDLAKLPDWGHTFERPTVDMLIERSCRDLIGQLGMQELAGEEGRRLAVPPPMNWQHPPMHLLPLRVTLQTES
jgi:hypothetical protein